MLRRSVLALFVAMVALTVGTSVRDAGAAGGASYVVCHRPPGNPVAAQTITVGAAAAVAAHLKHGDTAGACGATAPGSNQQCLDGCSQAQADAIDSCETTFDPATACGARDTACQAEVTEQRNACIANAETVGNACRASCQ